MAQRTTVRTTYEVERTLQPIYSGGSIALSEDGRILAACLGEEALLTDLSTGKELARAEGDGEAITSLACESESLKCYWRRAADYNSNTLCIPSDCVLAIAVHAHIRPAVLGSG